MERSALLDLSLPSIATMQLAASPPEDVMTLFNEYVLAMAECLLKGGDDPDTPAGRRLVRQCTT